MRLLYCILLFHFGLALCAQQKVYKLDKSKDIPIISASVGLGIYDLIKYNSLDPLSIEQIQQLNKNDVLSIDRFATNTFSSSSQKLSDIVGFSAFALPVLALIPSTCKNEYGALAVMLGETVILNTAITTAFKVTVKRNRPIAYNSDVPLPDKMIKNARMSFFSGHVSNTAGLCFFGAKVFSDLNPTSKWKKPMWITAATIPAVVGAARIGAGKHYLTDVLVGYGVGAAIGILIPSIHKVRNKNIEITVLGTGGIGLVYKIQ